MKETLLIDKSYQIVNIISWKKAFCLLFLEKVEVLDNYKEEIHSSSVTFKIPSIIRLVNAFHRNSKIIKFSKCNVFTRDKYICQYCGKKFLESDLTFDHVIPKSKGGKSNWENIVTCCKKCNIKKGNNFPVEVKMFPIKTPKKPKWNPFFMSKIFKNQELGEIWKKYCQK